MQMIYLIYKFIFGFHMIHILICQIYVGNIYFEILQKWPFNFFSSLWNLKYVNILLI